MVAVAIPPAAGALGLLLIVVGLGHGEDALDGGSGDGGPKEGRLRSNELTLLRLHLDQLPLQAMAKQSRAEQRNGKDLKGEPLGERILLHPPTGDQILIAI